MKGPIAAIVLGAVLVAGSGVLYWHDSAGGAASKAVDANGQTAPEFVRSTYLAMVENRYADVQARFNAPYLQYIEGEGGSLEGFFEPHVGAWRADRLAVKPMRKQVRPDMYRIKAFQDDGTGRPGVVNDVMLIDGQWTYVLWSNFMS